MTFAAVLGKKSRQKPLQASSTALTLAEILERHSQNS